MAPFNQEQFELETAIEAAELKRSQGDITEAYIAYQAIVDQRLGEQHNATDLTVFHSFAELATIHGDFELAHHALARVVMDCQTEDNLHWADFAVLRRIHLVLESGQEFTAGSALF